MTILGPSALMDMALPTGIDASYILNFEMREGMTPQEVIGLAATVIGEVNQELETQYGGITMFTSSLSAKYRQASGSRRMTPVASEFAGPDPVRSDSIGHMFTIQPYNDATGWSVEYLQEANRESIRFDLQEIRDSWHDRVDYDVVTRMFTDTEHLLGSVGYSPGWAIGTGTSLNYIPPNWKGKTFDSTHTHFKRTVAAISATNTATALKTMAKELAEHGLSGRKIALVSEADLDTYLAMSGKQFVVYKPVEFVLNAGASDITTISGELEGVPGEIFGYYQTPHGIVELRYHERIPTGYLWMGKSFGTNDGRNPLAIRFNPNLGANGSGFGMYVQPQVDRSLVPRLEYLKFDAQHGVNVNNRLNGVVYQITSGGSGYDNPTIT